jgi:hypothetical protein
MSTTEEPVVVADDVDVKEQTQQKKKRKRTKKSEKEPKEKKPKKEKKVKEPKPPREPKKPKLSFSKVVTKFLDDGDHDVLLNALNDINDASDTSPFSAIKRWVRTKETEQTAARHLRLLSKALPVLFLNANMYLKSITVLRNLYTPIIKKKDEVKSNLTVDQEILTKKNKKSAEVLLNKLTDVQVTDEKKVMDAVEAWKNSDRINDQLLLICLCAGTRLIEAMRVTPIPTKAKTKGWIVIENVAKLNNAKKSIKLPFIRPLMFISHKELVDVWSKVREFFDSKKDKTNEQLANSYNKRINERCRKFFPDLSAHGLRSLYADAAHAKYGTPKVDRGVFINRILGHVEDSASGNNYKYRVIDKSGAGIADMDDDSPRASLPFNPSPV